MSHSTEFLINIRRIIRLHESMLKEICGKYQMNLMEATVMSFLYNNPEKDTATDIVELRMLQKSNVSQAVESLAQRGFISRTQDRKDRRRIHLSLTEKAGDIVRELDEIREAFHREIFRGLSEEDIETFHRVNEQIGSNISKAEKRREQQ